MKYEVAEKTWICGDVYWLVPPPPSPPVFWNHRVSGIFLTWSLNLKGLYQSILEKGVRGSVRHYACPLMFSKSWIMGWLKPSLETDATLC